MPAAIAPVLVGVAEAYRVGAFEMRPALVCLGFALLVQIATNLANDYFDFVKGADTGDRLGPERLVASGRIQPKAMLASAVGVFAAAFFLGLDLVAYRGWELLVVGVLSIIFGYAYTGGPYPLAYHGLGDVFVVFFFGLVATGGSFYVQTGQLSGEALLLGLALGLLANNILVANNCRDRETDAAAGKRTLVVRWGAPFGRTQFKAQLIGAYLALGVYVIWTGEGWAGLPLLSAPWARKLWLSMPRWEGRALNQALADSAKLLLAFSALLAAGLWLSA